MSGPAVRTARALPAALAAVAAAVGFGWLAGPAFSQSPPAPPPDDPWPTPGSTPTACTSATSATTPPSTARPQNQQEYGRALVERSARETEVGLFHVCIGFRGSARVALHPGAVLVAHAERLERWGQGGRIDQGMSGRASRPAKRGDGQDRRNKQESSGFH